MSDSNYLNGKNLRVLISGAGIGGLVAAYWLEKAGFSVTVLERASELRREGHIIGVRKEAVPIIEYMGLGESLRGRMSGELGLKIVDEMDKAWASIPVGDSGFTSPLQLRRGELVAALYEVTKDKVDFIFGDAVETVEEVNDSLRVTLTNHQSQSLHFDFLLVAEGLRSHTRAKVFNEAVNAPILSLGVLSASFSYKSDEDWARWYHSPKSQALLVRPDQHGMTRVNAFYRLSGEQLAAGRAMSRDQYREQILRRFRNTGWESEKIMKGLSDAQDLHIQELAQARCKTWSKGRTALVGDSAWCSSPVGGMGATAAIVGGYTLAAELVKNPTAPKAAFRAYEVSLRPWIEAIQKPAPMVVKFGLPETRFGISCLHCLVSAPVSTLLSLIVIILQKLGLSKPKGLPKISPPSIFKPVKID